jgi:hypothetical protein
MTSTISTDAGTLTYPNILILISDQTRYPQHWPAGWAEKNLPTMTRLMNNALTFTSASRRHPNVVRRRRRSDQHLSRTAPSLCG